MKMNHQIMRHRFSVGDRVIVGHLDYDRKVCVGTVVGPQHVVGYPVVNFDDGVDGLVKEEVCPGILIPYSGRIWNQISWMPPKNQNEFLERAVARIYPSDMRMNGGAWLGGVRSWMQSRVKNGESVTWGSNDILEHQFTVRDVEEIASIAAAAMINEIATNDLDSVRERVKKTVEDRLSK